MTNCDGDGANFHNETVDDTSEVGAPVGTSPYASGGGGFTFERKVAAQYLAHILLGDGAFEFGEGRQAVCLAFQQAPEYPVDDLVIYAARPEENEPSLELALGVRRSPNLVLSDDSTRKLFREFVRAVLRMSEDGPESRLGLVVAGTQEQAKQLGGLADLAKVQVDPSGFFDLVGARNRFNAGIRNRLDQLEKLVGRALQDVGVSTADTLLVRQTTWQLLSKLSVLMPRLESPDETDWFALENSLIPVAREHSLSGASLLRDRLLTLADEYSPSAARVDITLLRRDAHLVLDSKIRRHREGWQILNHLNDRALGLVRNEITDSNGVHSLILDRSGAEAQLVSAVAEAGAMVVGGESGVGKSALVFQSLSVEDPDTSQALCINLRHIPNLTVDLEARLGRPLSALLSELSAPNRILIIDGTDSVTEGMEDAFRYLVAAAVESQVKVVAITSTESIHIVHEILLECFGAGLAGYTVEPLTDAEISEIVKVFPELKELNANPRSRELLRRLVVVDLLVRGRPSGVPLSEADAMQEVWSGLVRRHERSDRGHPDARESVLLRLADLSLTGGERLDVISGLDANAMAGLRQDGLLQRSLENPFMVGPDFAHDEIRRYAVARLFLTNRDISSRILATGAPRWSLPAARLACQAFLQQPDSLATPLNTRFDGLQRSFDVLIEAGHETRWADVPSEALLTLADPSVILRDAWPGLRDNDWAGLRRLARLLDQRLRNGNGIINPMAIEPIVSLMLEDVAPWRSGDHASFFLREWLYGHVMAGTPTGHPLRILLRERLVAACKEADRRLLEHREAQAAARAARTPEEVERERQISESYGAHFLEAVHGNRRRRERPDVPHECQDRVFVELLSLVGRDLGDQGEAILRRLAQDAPSSLAPAVEEPLTDIALASHGRGFLAQLTQAYYLDDESDGSASIDDDGIRDHRSRRRGIWGPLAEWDRGPFWTLFQTDFRGGVRVLNRMLNHAALVRTRKVARLRAMGGLFQSTDIVDYRVHLEITGTSRVYVGDEHVWRWYRGTGVGPYPCMSALQALERVCDQLISVDVPIERLISILLDGCENLAMVGLIVGLLVRHLEQAGNLLDPYFTEPLIWRMEFRRVVDEHGMLAASSEGIEAPERRKWSLQQAAMFMVLGASDDRVADLHLLGLTLVETARLKIEQEGGDDTDENKANDSEDIEMRLAPVRLWASSLDRDSYQLSETPDGLYIQARPSEEIVQALQHGNEDLDQATEAIRLSGRYFFKLDVTAAESLAPDELAADVESARRLLEAPPSFSENHPWDVPAAVAAAALEANILRCVDVPADSLAFAVDVVLRVAEGEPSPGPFEFEGTFFEQGADRSAARVLPLLLIPAAGALRAIYDGADGTATFGRVSSAGLNIAQAIANEVRLHLARGLDHLWATPCAQQGTCHHQIGWQIATATMRDCAVGSWDPETGMHRAVVLEEPLINSLQNIAVDSIEPSRLDASIRALSSAAIAGTCISIVARDLLAALLAAQRRSLLNYEDNNMDHRGNHSLVSARALLTLAGRGEDALLYEHINAFAGNSALLGDLLRALSAAAGEAPDRAATARRMWPNVIRQVLDLHNTGRTRFQEGLFGELALAALIPNHAPANAYMYMEMEGEPITWWDAVGLRPDIELWLETAAGNGRCVDQLIECLRALTEEEQAKVGLPWVAGLVLHAPAETAKSSFLVATWLIDIRPHVAPTDLPATWQKIVDALVVEGVTRLAPYSE